MFLKMNAFKALTKKAYNTTGLTVGNDGEGIYLMGGYWSIWLERTMMPKKAKAAIIELIGSIPAPGRAAAFYKSDDTNWEERDLLPEEVYRPRHRHPYPHIQKRTGSPAEPEHHGVRHTPGTYRKYDRQRQQGKRRGSCKPAAGK